MDRISIGYYYIPYLDFALLLVFILAIIAFIAWSFVKKRKRFDVVFEIRSTKGFIVRIVIIIASNILLYLYHHFSQISANKHLEPFDAYILSVVFVVFAIVTIIYLIANIKKINMPKLSLINITAILCTLIVWSYFLQDISCNVCNALI